MKGTLGLPLISMLRSFSTYASSVRLVLVLFLNYRPMALEGKIALELYGPLKSLSVIITGPELSYSILTSTTYFPRMS